MFVSEILKSDGFLFSSLCERDSELNYGVCKSMKSGQVETLEVTLEIKEEKLVSAEYCDPPVQRLHLVNPKSNLSSVQTTYQGSNRSDLSANSDLYVQGLRRLDKTKERNLPLRLAAVINQEYLPIPTGPHSFYELVLCRINF